jgi:hypothetical protein
MTGEDILEFIKKYRTVLNQMEETIPDNFPLWDVIEKFDREQNFVEELANRKARLSGQPTAPTPAEAPTTPAPSEESTPTPAAPEPAPSTPDSTP